MGTKCVGCDDVSEAVGASIFISADGAGNSFPGLGHRSREDGRG